MMARGEARLVVGADGLIGSSLVAHLRRRKKAVFETSRRPGAKMFLDLASHVANFEPPEGVSVAYLCAAITSLEACRTAPRESARVNVENTVALAKRLIDRNVFVVFLSSNLVFDGTRPRRRANEAVCPRTEYGRQKAEAESRLLALGRPLAIVRFAKVFGHEVPLLGSWLDALRNRRTIHPFSDMALSPVPLEFAVAVLERVGELRLPGIVQVSGSEDVTYAQVARRALERVGAPAELLRPVPSTGSELEAPPAFTTLDTTRLETEVALKPPSVWQTIDSLLVQ